MCVCVCTCVCARVCVCVYICVTYIYIYIYVYICQRLFTVINSFRFLSRSLNLSLFLLIKLSIKDRERGGEEREGDLFICRCLPPDTTWHNVKSLKADESGDKGEGKVWNEPRLEPSWSMLLIGSLGAMWAWWGKQFHEPKCGSGHICRVMAWTRQQGLVPYIGFEKVRGDLWGRSGIFKICVYIFVIYIYIHIYISGAEMGLVLLVPGTTNNSVNVIQNGLKIIH